MKKTLVSIVAAGLVSLATSLPVGAASVESAIGTSIALPTGVTVTDMNALDVNGKKVALFDAKTLTAVNTNVRKSLAKNSANTYEGDALKGIRLYQVQGTDTDGHHVGYLVSCAWDDQLAKTFVSPKDRQVAGSYWGLQESVKASPKDLKAFHDGFRQEQDKSIDNQAQSKIKTYESYARAGAMSPVRLADMKDSIQREAALYKLLDANLGSLIISPVVGQTHPTTVGTWSLALSYDGFSLPLGGSFKAVDDGTNLNVLGVLSIDASRPYWHQVIRNLQIVK